MSALSKTTSSESRGIMSFGPSPKFMGLALLYGGLPSLFISASYFSWSYWADFFTRHVCAETASKRSGNGYTPEALSDMAPQEAYQWGFSDGHHGSYVGDAECTSNAAHLDLFYGIPATVMTSTFICALAVGIFALVALAHQYRTDRNGGSIPGENQMVGATVVLSVMFVFAAIAMVTVRLLFGIDLIENVPSEMA